MAEKHKPVVFKSKIFWPKIYKSFSPSGDRNEERYGFSCDWADVPHDLTRFVKFQPARNMVDSCSRLRPQYCREFGVFRQMFAPQVVTHDNRQQMGEIAMLCDMMRAGNTSPNLLFDGVEAEILVQPYEHTQHHDARGRFFGRGARDPEISFGSQVLAIRVSYYDLLASYDMACALYFKD